MSENEGAKSTGMIGSKRLLPRLILVVVLYSADPSDSSGLLAPSFSLLAEMRRMTWLWVSIYRGCGVQVCCCRGGTERLIMHLAIIENLG
jgi:hypothetical protein